MCLKAYPHITLLCNGEIYNAFTLRDTYEFQFESQCDTEIIIHLYERFGTEQTAALLDGVFAFAILDTKKRQLHLGRDLFGVRPLFSFFSKGLWLDISSPSFEVTHITGALGVYSEVKGIQYPARRLKADIHPFPPGHIHTYELDSQGHASFLSDKLAITIGDSYPGVALSSSAQTNVHMLLKEAVRKRLLAGRRIGCLPKENILV